MRAALVALLLGSGALLAFFLQPSDEVVITKTDHGFVPEAVVIDAGTIVRFENDTARDFWPASDSHPTHQMYAGFDPGAPVAEGTSWSFVFERPGVWEFHDHLDSIHTGSIVVRGAKGETTASCLESRQGKMLTPECWEAEMVDALRDGGLTAAFTRVDELYQHDAAFRRNCHDVMHILGAAAYREFRASNEIVASTQTSYCGYGFYHGFVETMWIENGMSDFSTVREYCERVREDDRSASGPCFHGIGHAIFDSLPGTLWGNATQMTDEALAQCREALPEAEWQENCASGVYNALANAMSAGSYYLSFSGFDPDSFCSAQEPLFQKNCYGETGIGYIRNVKAARLDAIAWIRSIEEMRDHLFFIYFSDETKRSMGNLSYTALRDSCTSLKNERDVQSCIVGTLQGLREQAPAQKTFAHAFPFCSSLSAPLNAFCVQTIVSRTDTTTRALPEFAKECRAATPAEEASWCVL